MLLPPLSREAPYLLQLLPQGVVKCQAPFYKEGLLSKSAGETEYIHREQQGRVLSFDPARSYQYHIYHLFQRRTGCLLSYGVAVTLDVVSLRDIANKAAVHPRLGTLPCVCHDESAAFRATLVSRSLSLSLSLCIFLCGLARSLCIASQTFTSRPPLSVLNAARCRCSTPSYNTTPLHDAILPASHGMFVFAFGVAR